MLDSTTLSWCVCVHGLGTWVEHSRCVQEVDVAFTVIWFMMALDLWNRKTHTGSRRTRCGALFGDDVSLEKLDCVPLLAAKT